MGAPVPKLKADLCTVAVAGETQTIPDHFFAIRTSLPFIPLQRHEVVGNGEASDMDNMNEALAEMSETGKALVPEAGRAYHFGSQLRLPERTLLDIPEGTTFHFHAADAFTSTTRPSVPGSTDGHCVYAEERSDVEIHNLRIVFHPKQYSYVHGLALRGGQHHRVYGYEGTGFGGGDVLKVDSVRDILIFDPYVHDCTLDMPTGGPAAGQLSGFDLDNDRILNPDGSARLSTGRLIRGRFERLLATPQTILTGPGRQTDGLTLISHQVPPTEGWFDIDGTWIEEVYEGIDAALAARLRVRRVGMKNIGVTALKAVHGTNRCSFRDIEIDGVGQSAIALYGSGTLYDTRDNLFDGIRVTRCGDWASGKVPQLNDPAIIRIVDTGPNSGCAKFNTIRNIDAYANSADTRAIIFDGIRAGTEGNRIGRITADGIAVTDNAAAQTLGLVGRVDVAVGPQKARTVGDAAVTLGLFDRTVLLGATLTAPRTCTLPRARNMPPGERITVRDPAGYVGDTNTLSFQVAPTSGDFLRPGPITLTAPYGVVTLESDGVSTWQRVV